LARAAIIILAMLLVLSIIFNFGLIAVVGSTALLFGGSPGPIEKQYADGNNLTRIVILPISGLIADDQAEFVREALAKLRHNKPKAVVLRVDSGGGTVAASDRIANELDKFRAETGVPIVASFGGIAASGGYYVAANADHIFVEPTTITGSIGVIAEAFTFDELVNKIGVKPEIVTATPATKKDMLNPFRPWTEDDRQALRAILDDAYGRFVTVVANGRKRANLTRQDVEALATGEVFTAKQAVANKLADAEGYLGDAIEKAKSLAGLSTTANPEVRMIEQPRPFSILGAFGASTPPMNWKDLDGAQVRRWAAELSAPRLEYRCIR